MPLEKAYITNLETNDQIPCLFNPTDYSLSKSNQWESATVIGDNLRPPVFIGGEAMTLSMTLFFDTYGETKADRKDVRKYTEKLLALMYVNPKLRSDKNKKGRPPRCQFNWGRTWGFKAIITQMTQRFTMFLEDGTPVRATVELTFQQIQQQGTYVAAAGQSKKQAQKRTRTVRPGDRLDSIAFEEYGSSARWKDIARANNLARPDNLQPGTELTIP
jgi:hypothetical protein